MVQTIVRSNRFPDPVISVWQHKGVRWVGSNHRSIWVWTKTWEWSEKQRSKLTHCCLVIYLVFHLFFVLSYFIKMTFLLTLLQFDVILWIVKVSFQNFVNLSNCCFTFIFSIRWEILGKYRLRYLFMKHLTSKMLTEKLKRTIIRQERIQLTCNKNWMKDMRISYKLMVLSRSIHSHLIVLIV